MYTKRAMLVGGLMLAGLTLSLGAAPASAGVVVGGYYGGYPAYVAPAPVYVPPPVYYAPAPYYVAPPAYYAPYRYYYPHRHHRSFSFAFGYWH